VHHKPWADFEKELAVLVRRLWLPHSYRKNRYRSQLIHMTHKMPF
jgi:hypothetical protein